MALTTKEQVKATLGISGIAFDGAIDAVIDGVSAWFARYCDRYMDGASPPSLIEYGEGRVQEYTLEEGESFVTLAGLPIVSIEEVVAASTRPKLDTEDLLVADVDWYLRGSSVQRVLSDSVRKRPFFYSDAGLVRVTYTCGFWTGDVEDLPEGATMLSPEIAEAAKLQAVHMFQNRDKFGNRSIQVGSMSIDQVHDGLLQTAKDALAPLQRVTLVG